MRLVSVLFASLFACTLCLSAKAGGSNTEDFDQWYCLLLQNQPSGWMHHTCKTGDGRIVSDEQVHMAIGRGENAVTIEAQTSFVETPDGKPIECRASQTLGRMKMLKTYRFLPDGIELTTEQAGQTAKQRLPLPEGQWFTPAAADRYSRAQLQAGAKEIRLRIIDCGSGIQPISITSTIGKRKNIQVMGKTVPAIEVQSSMSNMPGVMVTNYADENGHVLKTEMEMIPGMKVTVLAADRDLAMGQVNPPELLNLSILKPDRPIAAPRKLRHGVYELHFKPNGTTRPAAETNDLSFPSGGVQQVVWKNNAKTIAQVTVDLDHPADCADLPTDADRKPSTMIDGNDPQVRALAAKALAGKSNLTDDRKAELLRDFANRYIQTKDLSVGFASATEVARTAEGDCTEHAVLLAALLRSEGIPSRVVSGLVYADQFAGHQGIFGYHMWTRAFLADPHHPKGRWVDLDATLHETPFDATHIALDVSQLSDATQTNDMIMICRILGRVSIKVVQAK